jgi:sulfoxide reductase heme-binding subunit YedZ
MPMDAVIRQVSTLRRYLPADPDDLLRRGVKPAVFVLCLVPALLLLIDSLGGRLGANPVEALSHRTGDWALRLLLVTLAVTPLRRITGWGRVLRLRRMLGLFAFFYATLHVVVYVWLDRQLTWSEIVVDLSERPYITLGFFAFVILSLLAATSPKAMVRRLGRSWKRLHRAVYAAAVLAVVHFWWLVKAEINEPAIYAVVLAALFAARYSPTRN